MPYKSLIKKSQYHDSVSLMLVAKQLSAMPGVRDAAVVMGTEANKGILGTAGLLTPEAQAAGPNDLIISVEAGSGEVAAIALAMAEGMLAGKVAAALEREEYRPKTLDTALRALPEANLVVISVAGRYAAAEARRALEKGLHVFLFSNNVPLEDEIALKRYAKEKGLLLMGPDAGTAIINGVALGFANAVPRGRMGVVGAAGTGLQSVTSLIAWEGEGISQAIGVGGRDLSEAVGGLMMMEGLRALQADPQTEVLVLVAKPPHPTVAEKVLNLVGESDKPTVVAFLGRDQESIRQAGATPAATLEEAALVAVKLAQGRKPIEAAITLAHRDDGLERLAAEIGQGLSSEQRYVRGLFCGGTFCYEAMLVLQALIGAVHSNVPLDERLKLADSNKSVEHTVVDLGADEFTLGRLHPMLDLSLRNRRILWEARDPQTAIILLDLVLGYGVHPDPADETATAVFKARELAKRDGRKLLVISSICGTQDDPQGLAEQEKKLRQAGAIVLASNVAAAKLAGLIVGSR